MIRETLRKLGVIKRNSSDTKIITDEMVTDFIKDPDFPYLVSFPRTGSHWLRMIMELYFEKPSMKLIFFEPYLEATDFTCVHSHDMELEVKRASVFYLYRQPAPTIFSQLRYYQEDINDTERIVHWATIYGQHLKKWIFEETFTTHKTILSYEEMRKDLPMAFGKVCEHFKVNLDKERLEAVAEQVSKKKLKEKTVHDKQVVNLSNKYDEERQQFMAKYTDLILQTVVAQHPSIAKLF
ncbi:MAG: sulfotransferase domain-containing protein [Saprospiraceae bacterium]